MYGTFSGNPKTEWLDDPGEGDREMRVLEDFWYDDPDGRRWPAPAGSVINGASIPRPLWSTVGSPYTDDYRRASIVHDVACNDSAVPRKEADRMFYFACLGGGCTRGQARILYAGVRIGAWAGDVFPRGAFSRKRLLYRLTERPQIEERKVCLKFDEIARELQKLGDEAGFEEIEAVVDGHM
jgi:hypothetical protein